DLYVNEYSIDLGAEGRRAVEILFERARAAGIVPNGPTQFFLGRSARPAATVTRAATASMDRSSARPA
ncbi:MAG TPA: hypothetical protein VKD69_17205, partial [Vicinamibacterales bacterium]|nr:hypothetical protein [Vicinamibacterales bacterium]